MGVAAGGAAAGGLENGVGGDGGFAVGEGGGRCEQVGEALEEGDGAGAGGVVAGEAEEGAYLGGAGGVEGDPAVFPAVGAGGEIVRFAGIIDEDIAGAGLKGVAAQAVGAAAAGGPKEFEKPFGIGAFNPTSGNTVVPGGAHGEREAGIGAAGAGDAVDEAAFGAGGAV